MKIITLMEDTVGKEGALAEHGLCLYMETKRHKLLVDTGQSELTWENAKRLGVDLSKVDMIVISHGHSYRWFDKLCQEFWTCRYLYAEKRSRILLSRRQIYRN